MLLGMSNYIKVNNFGQRKKRKNKKPSSVQYFFFPLLKRTFKKRKCLSLPYIKANVKRIDSVLYFVRKRAWRYFSSLLSLWYPSELYFHSCKID